MKVKCCRCGKTFDTKVRGFRPEQIDWICSAECNAKWEIMLEKTKWSYS